MKDFLKTSMVLVALLALFMGLRIALFVPLHNEMMAVEDSVPVAATDKATEIAVLATH